MKGEYKNPEIKRDGLRAHKSLEDIDDVALANLLYNSKKDEQLVADEGGRYTITAKGRGYLKDAGVAMPPAGKKPRGRGEATVRITGKNGSRHVKAAPGSVVELGPDERAEIVEKSDTNGTARAIAEQLLDDSQAALDRYIESVCDSTVLARFRAARDRARELVGSFDGAGEHPEGGEHG